MTKRIIIAAILFLPTTVPAQTRGEGVPVRLSECIQAAMGNNPSLKISMNRLDAASARTAEIRSALFPQLKLSGRAAQLSEVPEFTIPFLGTTPIFASLTRNYSARLTLQQNIFSGFRLANGVDVARHQEEALGFDYSRDRSDLVLNVVTAYWNLYRAGEVEGVLFQSVQQVEAHVKDAENFHAQGLATDLDLLRVKTQLSDIRIRLIEAQSAVRIAAMSLNSLTGTPLLTPVVPADTPPEGSDSSGDLSDVEQIISLARSRRAEVSSMAARRDMADASVAAAQGGWYPQILLLANYEYARPNQRIIPPKDAWEKSWDVGVVVQWNIWDWFATAHQSAQARANLAAAEASLTQVNNAVALEAAQNYFKAREAHERIGAAALGLQQAEEAYRISSEKYERGAASNTDLLDAELALLQARLMKVTAVIDFAIQTERLKKSLGAPL